MQTLPGFTAQAALGVVVPSGVPGFGGGTGGSPFPFDVPPEWLEKHAAEIEKELRDALKKVGGKLSGTPPPQPPRPAPAPPKPKPPSRQAGRVHTGVLFKMMGTAMLVGCELQCAMDYNACLVRAQAEFDQDVDQCEKIRDKALELKRKGLIPDSTSSIFRQANDCIDSAESRFNISAGICATRYGICSLSCFIPYSPFS